MRSFPVNHPVTRIAQKHQVGDCRFLECPAVNPMVALQRTLALANDALAGKPSVTKQAKVLPVVRLSIVSVGFFAHKCLAGKGEVGAAISLPRERLLLRAWRFKGAGAVTVSPVLARWSIFAYACPSFVGLTGISQLALNRIKLAVIVIPFQLHPFGGESFSGFFHSRRIEQRPLTRLEHPPRGRTRWPRSRRVLKS